MLEPLFPPGSGPIQMKDIREAATGIKLVSDPREEPLTGITFIPPPTLKIPDHTAEITQKKFLTSDGLSVIDPSSGLPETFSWHKPADVEEYFYPLRGDIISPPADQHACGACWAFATAMALSDRIAIVKGKNPNLGPSYLLGCSNTEFCDASLKGCDGGEISDALNNMRVDTGNAGAVSSDCWGYKWCSNNYECTKGDVGNEEILNAILKKTYDFARDRYKCVDNTQRPLEIYKVISSTGIWGGIETIRKLLFSKGPIPSGIILYEDFTLGAAHRNPADNWVETGGIYVHLDTRYRTSGEFAGKWTTKNGDESPYKYGTPESMATRIAGGGHALVIVGWGMKIVKNFFTASFPEKTHIQLPYWWVRNSWGTHWGENGYFKMAMVDIDLEMNLSTKLDGGSGPYDFDVKYDPIQIPTTNLSNNYRNSRVMTPSYRHSNQILKNPDSDKHHILCRLTAALLFILILACIIWGIIKIFSTK